MAEFVVTVKIRLGADTAEEAESFAAAYLWEGGVISEQERDRAGGDRSHLLH